MLTKLKQRYKQEIIINETPEKHSAYEWFLSEKQDLIGIKKNALSETEYELLTVFLNPIQPNFTTPSQTNEKWRNFLYGQQTDEENNTFIKTTLQNIESIQFLHFHTPKAFFEKEEFQEALTGLIATPFVIIWKDYSNGVIILYNPQDSKEHLECLQIVSAIQTDFFIDLTFFVGKIYTVTNKLNNQFLFEETCFSHSLKHKNKQSVYTLAHVIPQWIVSHLSPEEKEQFHLNLLGELAQEKELLQTIKVFIECNLNLSLTAKTLFLHRNSVQYRIDRFIQRTGIDIKQFKEALLVYLTFL
ncbi:MAG: PucR family transcriptional regulator [Bacillaceae bacterium]